MTWKEFKTKVECLGVNEDDEIWYIDIAFDEDFEVKKMNHVDGAFHERTYQKMKKWPISEKADFLTEKFPFPENLKNAYVYECKSCKSKSVFVWTQPSRTNPGHICHLLICTDCGDFCAMGGVNKIVEFEK